MRATNRPFSNRILLALCLVLGSTVLGAGSVQAGYPGSQNGRLAYGIRVDGNIDLYSSLPTGGAVRRLTTGLAFDACRRSQAMASRSRGAATRAVPSRSGP